MDVTACGVRERGGGVVCVCVVRRWELYAQTVQQSRAMKSHPPAQPKHDRLLFKRPQISNTEMIYPTIDHGKIMDQQDDQSVEEETYDYMHGEEIFIFDMDLGEDDDAMNDGKKPAKATCEASRAPSSEQNNAPMTPETVAPQASATTTASTFVTTTPLQQPPLGPRPPTGPKKNNIRNRGRPVDWKRNSGMVDISPEKPELISFDVPPVLAPRPPVQAPRPPVLASRPPTSKPDGNRKHANLAPRNPTSKPDGNRRHANLAPRPPTSKPDGNRKHANLAARPPTSKPDGNRRHANLAPRPPTSKPDGNRKHANLAPRHPTSKPDDNRRHANPAPRPPTSKPDGNSKHTNLAPRPPTSKPDGNRKHANLAPRPPTSKPDGNRRHANLAPRPPTSKPDGNRKHANLAPRHPTSKPDGNRRHANPAPRPPTSKLDGNSRYTTNKFHRTTQKSARQRQKTKPSDAQTVQQSRAMKSHPPAQPKHDRLLFKRPQISNTEMIYPTIDHGKIMGQQDDQSVEEETYDYMHGEEIFIFDMDLGEDDDAMNDGKKPAKATCEASRAPIVSQNNAPMTPETVAPQASATTTASTFVTTTPLQQPPLGPRPPTGPKKNNIRNRGRPVDWKRKSGMVGSRF
eukprot:XP_011672927.1 PREDICTED: soluble scavenger receptor cysteine-rich domain-containing protein SSC5D-like [Strongylocentrotus purpuratus]